MAFNPDGKGIASGSDDRTVKLWDTDSYKQVVSWWSWPDGAWLALAPERTFDGSPQGLKHLGFQDGDVIYPADEFAHWFRRDGTLIQERMASPRQPV